jgi:transposase-like protein
MPAVDCAFCDSPDTEPTSVYGCHMLTAQYLCRACKSTFDWVRDD